MTSSPSDEDPAPVVAAAKLTELNRLAARAPECWQSGDQKGALDAVAEAVPAAAAADADDAALNTLAGLGRMIAEEARRQAQGGDDPSDRLG